MVEVLFLLTESGTAFYNSFYAKFVVNLQKKKNPYRASIC